ncbi:MAG: hypothetical protein AAF125_09080 [Chloroflexota bacterium]
MEYTVSFYADERVMYVKTVGEMTIEDWRGCSLEMDRQIRERPHVVHVVVDMLDTPKHPTNILELMTATVWAKSPDLGHIVHVTNDRLTSVLGTIVIQGLMGKYHAVGTREKAFEYLYRMDPSLSHDG